MKILTYKTEVIGLVPGRRGKTESTGMNMSKADLLEELPKVP